MPVSPRRALTVARELSIATQKYLLVDEFKLVQLFRFLPEPRGIDDWWNKLIE